MTNKFYSDFDFERVSESGRKEDYRTPFQIDRDRLIHSSEFRRLQGKTQVFIPGDSDYYRTRLTHSIEVAQIGRSICYYLKTRYKDIFSDEYFIDPDLVESACLAHDLGHPPFGHAGERTLHKLMSGYGGFEGNAQTLRLIAEIFYTTSKSRRGMKPTRALVDAVLKYKTLYSQIDNPSNHYLYDFQKEYVDFVFDNRSLPSDLSPGKELNSFQSIECQIMDWADDTAYATNDLVDSISGGFITIIKLEQWFEKNKNTLSEYQQKVFDDIKKWIRDGSYKAKFGTQIGKLVQACSIDENPSFMSDLTNRYKYRLIIGREAMERVKLFKKIAIELVFQSSQLHQMEYKGDIMLTGIFRSLEENYITDLSNIKLLPDFNDNLIRKETETLSRSRIVCDYISGMTDSFAMNTYKRLFDPDFSSIKDYV
jgi:dGTPase